MFLGTKKQKAMFVSRMNQSRNLKPQRIRRVKIVREFMPREQAEAIRDTAISMNTAITPSMVGSIVDGMEDEIRSLNELADSEFDF